MIGVFVLEHNTTEHRGTNESLHPTESCTKHIASLLTFFCRDEVDEVVVKVAMIKV